ncbi:hypothetical protein EAO69_23755 [Streptomyces sp. me109]|uniref:hypothetical protein n=1 Tax=Streptomyces sp. me109 TaxID=1827853 RepID=UPI0011CE8445|nr:hypothetical protein [Streptomyces sp. me109]TXS71011.1 hypothetical protein EAO69_23755 [Streptomyces sp. me109]
MSDDPLHVIAVPARRDLQLPRFLRPLLPTTPLKGWLMPLVFAVLALGFWGYSNSKQDPRSATHTFDAVCFAVVSVSFVVAKGWVEWRLRRGSAEE